MIPFKGNPWRPIYISALLCGFLGLILSAIGLFALVALAINSAHKGVNSLQIVGGFLFYGSVGTVYFFCAHWLNRLRLWAAIIALSITSIGLIVVLALSVYSVVDVVGDGHVGDSYLWFFFGAIWLIELIVIAMLILLIHELIRCFGAIRILLQAGRGFEVLPSRPQDEALSKHSIP